MHFQDRSLESSFGGAAFSLPRYSDIRVRLGEETNFGTLEPSQAHRGYAALPCGRPVYIDEIRTNCEALLDVKVEPFAFSVWTYAIGTDTLAAQSEEETCGYALEIKRYDPQSGKEDFHRLTILKPATITDAKFREVVKKAHLEVVDRLRARESACEGLVGALEECWMENLHCRTIDPNRETCLNPLTHKEKHLCDVLIGHSATVYFKSADPLLGPVLTQDTGAQHPEFWIADAGLSGSISTLASSRELARKVASELGPKFDQLFVLAHKPASYFSHYSDPLEAHKTYLLQMHRFADCLQTLLGHDRVVLLTVFDHQRAPYDWKVLSDARPSLAIVDYQTLKNARRAAG